ncbi:centromere protein J [Python bivittatus]|uniref:Centrosomal P4.1-associated protein n=1 Tax=Python bivittatus TaxID=176946 RepID=A0A9F2R8R3_PYTBI|nr:centromere protein J [Python bivittatus]XP_007439904.1 centromere protein J [Python bivittatus]
MATSTDLNWEENLISHWMSNAARAGVILNPAFPGLKTTRAINNESISSGHDVNLLYSSSSISLSEEMHKEQTLEPKSSYEEKVDSSKTLFSASASNKEQMLMVKDIPAWWTAMETEPGSDQSDDLGEGCCTELLLQKLEQLKELQHHKKELLRRQQMEQIHRLMEEQQHLLSMVAEQQEHTGSPATEHDGTQNYAGSVCLSPAPYFPLCHSRSNTDWNSASHVSSPVEQRDYLQSFSNNQILKQNNSADPFCKKQSSDSSLKGKNELKLEDQKTISGRNRQSPEQSLQGSIEGDSDCEEQRNMEASKNLTAGKYSEAVNAEERPIPTSMQERKQTFEEFLEEQIRLEEQRLNEKGNHKVAGAAGFQKPVSKQPFLKRGEGLNRYTNAKYKVAKQKESKTILQPDPLEIKNSVKADKMQLHRKTAPSNKVSDNVVPKLGNQNTKTKKTLSFSARKTTVLRNCTGKGISLSSRQNCNETKPEVLRNSLRSEINGEKEKNKENVIPLAKVHETDVRLPAAKEALSEVTEFLINPREKHQELSFELSFQKKLGNWEAEKEKEKNELDEFLFLEQAADEISFASNSSLIIKILDQGQQISSGHRLSSTPIKSRLQEQQMNVLNVTAANNINGKNWVFQASNHERHKDNSQAPEPFMVRKSSADYEMFQTSPSAEFQDCKNTELDEDKSDGSSEMTSETEEELEITIKPASVGADKTTLKNLSDSPEYLECKEQMEGTKNANSPDSMEKDGGQSSELYRDAASPSVCCSDRNKFEFDDEISWSDFEENNNLGTQRDMVSKVSLSPDCSKTPFPDKVIKRKIAMVKKGDALLKQNITDNEETEPPTSDLMLKLFPSLKPKQKVDAQSRHEIKSNMTQEESSGETVRSQLLKEKLVELEMEIERFRTENASLSKLREEHETTLENLRKEKSGFEHHKAQELARIEELKKEEARKLQKERKVFEKYAQAARAIPDKKERDEIQALKQQIATLQEDVKRREAKWSATHTRLRDQIEALTKENTQLREEIKIMERFRLEAWKRKEAPTKKKKNSNSGYSNRDESTHLPAALPKSHSGSSMNQVEKSSKINVKSDLPSEGSLSPKCELARAHEADLDKMIITSEDSSKTFMANFPGDGTVESSVAVTFGSSDSEEEVEREASHPDGKIEKVLKNGCHLIIFPNGTRKEVSCDGKTTTVTFFNGDVKQVLEDQRVIYYYADAKTTHTTYPTGLEILHFSNGQIEKHFPDGKKEIIFPDQTIKNVFTDGREVNIFPDGTIVHMQQDGSKIIEFSNGQQEVHTAHFKRREYPDGTIKTVYADGRQETQYASGRLRVKNKNGDVIMDTHP